MSEFQWLCEEIEIGERGFTAHVLSPPQLAPNPLLLLTFAADWQTSLGTEPYNVAAQEFLARGHRVLSFDLPNHGARADEFGEHIVGWRNAFVAGQDCFEIFLDDCDAVINCCIEKKLAQPHRIAVGGTSRAGYLALRLLARDARIAAAAVFAPVTDWRKLREFRADRERENMAALQLENFAEELSGKPIFMVIGNHDDRVSSESCCRFYLALCEANARRGADNARLNFQIHDTPGHGSGNGWQQSGARFLLEQLGEAQRAPGREYSQLEVQKEKYEYATQPRAEKTARGRDCELF